MLRHLEGTEDLSQAQRAERKWLAPIFTEDKTVQKCQARLDRLADAGAAPEVLTRAAAALKDARISVMERNTEKIAATRATALAETKQKQRDAITRETVYRLSDDSPTITMEFYGVKVTLRPERPADGTRRVHVYAEVNEVLQIIRGMTEHVIGGVRRNLQPQIDRAHVIRTVKDRCRRGIASGAVEISEV